ncbi:MAG: protein-L-isoaspartate O-methyltransferase [Gammaproteobacteria bacterium]
MMSNMNLAQARHNMIEQQIRPWDVLDQRVLELIEDLPRDKFVPTAYLKLAYADINVPLDHGQVMMAPKVEARMLQALNIKSSDTILEVGTGSGYVTALLAHSGKHVYSVEIYPDFIENAGRRLAELGLGNVTLENGDAVNGWDRHGPYDVIAITGSLPALPDNFLQSLKLGGRLFVVTGQEPVMEAYLITRTAEQGWVKQALFETVLPPLVNAPQPQRFVF